MKTNMDYWNFALRNIPESYKKWFEEEKKYLKKNISPNSSVLEIGCGDGRSINDLINITKNITGIDHDNKAVKDATKQLSNYPTIKILKADALNLPFLKESFDYVICMTTFANFGDKKYLILDEMKRVLKNYGCIIISVFSEDALEERLKLYKASGVKIRKIENGKVTFNKSLGDNISEQFTRQELNDIFYKSGLNIKNITKKDIAYLCTLTK